MDFLKFYENVECTAERTPDESTVTASGHVENHLPGLAVDGNPDTFWSSGAGGPGDEIWLEVGFATVVEVKCVLFSDSRSTSPTSVSVQAHLENVWLDVLMYDKRKLSLLIDNTIEPDISSSRWRIKAPE